MSAKPSDIAFSNSSNNRDHNIFTEEFYGGADAFVYIEGERNEYISSISFGINEQKKPIYGYSSYTYDAIANGSRIVQGVIRIPIKNIGPSDRARKRATLPVPKREVKAPGWVYDYKPINTEDKNEEVNSVQDFKETRLTTAGKLLYSEPSSSGFVIKELDDDTVEMIHVVGDFVLVRTSNNEYGYIKRSE